MDDLFEFVFPIIIVIAMLIALVIAVAMVGHVFGLWHLNNTCS